jgi:hypothetical protein
VRVVVLRFRVSLAGATVTTISAIGIIANALRVGDEFE